MAAAILANFLSRKWSLPRALKRKELINKLPIIIIKGWERTMCGTRWVKNYLHSHGSYKAFSLLFVASAIDYLGHGISSETATKKPQNINKVVNGRLTNLSTDFLIMPVQCHLTYMARGAFWPLIIYRSGDFFNNSIFKSKCNQNRCCIKKLQQLPQF